MHGGGEMVGGGGGLPSNTILESYNRQPFTSIFRLSMQGKPSLLGRG
jgi:hypothetical protein